MTRLVLSTGNVMSGGQSILRKPGNERSNLELTNSLRNNFLNAQQDYTPPTSVSSNNGENENPAARNRPAPSIWTQRIGSELYVPRIDWSMTSLSEERSQYDITVKLFFLPGAKVKEREGETRRAIDLVLKELRVDNIDLLIISFPGMSFDGDCEHKADAKNATQGNDDEEFQTWNVMEDLLSKGTVKRLGLAEFGTDKLARFLAKARIRPEVDQINVKDCCNVPPALMQLAKKENIQLLTHSDCTDILPNGTVRELLGQGPQGAGLLSESKRGLDGMKGEITSKWVIKYTAVVRDRGVVEYKGYFAEADLDE